MADLPRLNRHTALPGTVAAPGFRPEDHGIGIVHIGPGAFHRAHAAVFTDAALAAAGGDWRIAAVSLHSRGIAAALADQDGRYSVTERGAGPPRTRVVGSIATAVSETARAGIAHGLLTQPNVRIVSLTITEKAYAETGGTSVAARLVAALADRRNAGMAPFACLSCDNLPDNGARIRSAMLENAAATDPALADWIAGNVACPSTMVDRITPAATDATLAFAARTLGATDLAAVETEPFSQWVIEDAFPAGRPAWDAGGALLVDDIAPYERMKLRMLNGAHSMLAYAGVALGLEHVRDAMGDADLSRAIQRHIRAAAATLGPMPSVDLAAYGRALTARFANPAIAHRTAQIAEDGTQKLPQRICSAAQDAAQLGQPLAPFALALALWLRHCTGRTEAGAAYDIRDPKAAAIASRIATATDAAAIHDALAPLVAAPDGLRGTPEWRRQVIDTLDVILKQGVRAALQA